MATSPDPRRRGAPAQAQPATNSTLPAQPGTGAPTQATATGEVRITGGGGGNFFSRAWDTAKTLATGGVAGAKDAIVSGAGAAYQGAKAGAQASYDAAKAGAGAAIAPVATLAGKLGELGITDANNPGLGKTDFGTLPVAPTRTTPMATAPPAYSPIQIAGAFMGNAPTVGQTMVGPAPTIAGTSVHQANDIRGTAYGAAQTSTPTPVGAERVQGTTYGAQQTFMPRDVVAERVAASQIGPVERAMATAAQQTRVARDEQAELRAIQVQQLDELQDIIAGRSGPSAAQLEQQRQAARAIAQQMGVARANAGATSAGLAAKDMADITAEIGQDSAMQQAILKAKEVEDARSGLRSLAGQARESDIGLATTDANLSNAVNLANASMETDISKTNAQMGNAADLEQARLEQAAAQSNQGATLAAQQGNQKTAAEIGMSNTAAQNRAAEFGAQTSLEAQKANQAAQLSAEQGNQRVGAEIGMSNTAAQNQASQFGAQMQMEAQKANQANQQAVLMEQARIDAQRAQQDAANQLAVLQQQANLDQQRGIVNAQLESEIQRAQAQLDQATMEFNASSQNEAAAKRFAAEVETELANQRAALEGQALSSDEWKAIMAAQTQRERMAIDKEIAERAARAEEYKGKMAAIGGAVGGAGGILTGIATLSDKRAKKNIRPAEPEINEFLARLGDPEAWEYTDPTEPGAGAGKKFGKMAQDLERSEVGRSFVRDVNGRKMLDVAGALGPVLASLGVLHREVQELRGS